MAEFAPEMPVKSALVPIGAESVRRCSSVPPMREGAHFGAGLTHPGQCVGDVPIRGVSALLTRAGPAHRSGHAVVKLYFVIATAKDLRSLANEDLSLANDDGEPQSPKDDGMARFHCIIL
jgi:hypothetical protein